MNGLILAAGLGTRLRPITDRIPKPAVPLLNIPMIYYAEYLLRPLRLETLVVNAHHLPNQIESLFPKMEQKQVLLSLEVPEILGSGGAIWKARPLLDDGNSFIICNADTVLIPKAEGLIEDFRRHHEASGHLATLMVMAHPEVGSKFNPVWVNSKGLLEEIGKADPPLSRGLHYVGIAMLSHEVFDMLPAGVSNILHDVLLPAKSAGASIGTYEVECEWFETGDQSSFLATTWSLLKLLESQQGPAGAFLKGLMEDHGMSKGIDLQRRLVLGEGTILGPGVTLIGSNVLGNHVMVSKGAHLNHVVALDGAVIREGSSIENQIVF